MRLSFLIIMRSGAQHLIRIFFVIHCQKIRTGNRRLAPPSNNISRPHAKKIRTKARDNN